jgi:Domain of unknown function (DUF4131)/Competence protein
VLWAAFAYGAGIVAGARAWKPALWWVIAALTFVGAGTYLSWLHVWLGFGLALGLLFFVGALEIQLRTSAPLAGREFLHFADGRETIIPAHVTHEGEIRAGSYGGSRQSIDVETEQVWDGDAGSTIHAGLRLGVYSKESDPEYEEGGTTVPRRIFRYGECLRFPVKLRAPRNVRNSTIRGYLADNDIVVLGSTHAAKIEVLPGFTGTRVAEWRDGIDHHIVRKTHALRAGDDAALMDATVIGESAFLTPKTKTDFQRSGTDHIRVVSGMNVSILAFVVFWVMRRSGWGM